ncbi:MAG: hypothetical protein J0L99_17545, partial [Chitinophagales bacterium]|nr:hypothetical protein [Chitinophagales bacterium]
PLNHPLSVSRFWGCKGTQLFISTKSFENFFSKKFLTNPQRKSSFNPPQLQAYHPFSSPLTSPLYQSGRKGKTKFYSTK